MAKSLLLNVLVDVLGNYVEGLSKENLKLGVWSGKIELFNLKLKNTALNNLNLPIQVSRGSLKQLKLKIPWTQLESKPVRVIIDGVYLQAGPLDLFQSSAEELRKTLHASKIQRLKETDSSIMASLTTSEGLHEKAQKATYVQQLTAKIVDNIEVTLTNVHIRYEDSVSIPGTTFSTGITIDSLSLSTTDENWSVAFISREIQSKVASAIHKLGVMENLGVYWNQNSRSLSNLEYSSWEDAMQALIYCNETPGSSSDVVVSKSGRFDLPTALQSMNYLLLPPNKLSVRIKHREVSTELDPKVDVAVESSTLPFLVDSVQYSQLMALGQALGELDRKRFLALSRPKARPTKDPRAWWFYAYQLVTGRERSSSSKTSTMVQCMRAKNMYISFVKKSTIAAELGGNNTTVMNSLSAAQDEINSIEEKLPLTALVVFRQIALKEAVVEIKRCRADPQYAASKGFAVDVAPKSSRFNFWGASKPKQTDFQDEAFEAAPIAKTSGSTIASVPSKIVVKSESTTSKAPKKTGVFSGWFSSSQSVQKPVGSAVSTVSEMAAPSKQPSAIAASSLIRQKSTDSNDSGSTDVDEEDDRVLQSIEAKLIAQSEEAAVPIVFSLRVTLLSKQTLTVTLRDAPVVFLSMESSARLEMRLNSVLFDYQMTNMFVEDTCTVAPFSKYLVLMRDASVSSKSNATSSDKRRVLTIDASSNPQVSVVFENKPGKNNLTLSSAPLEVTWNENCVQKLLAFVLGSSGESKTTNPALMTNMSRRFAAQTALPASITEVTVQMYAPKFIIPENCYRDDGYLLLDAGHLRLSGRMDPSLGMTWDVALQAVNIGMPLSRVTEDLLYLVKPFDISTALQNVNKTDADMSITVAVSPSIKGDLDAQKIARLVCVSQVVMRSFDYRSLDGDQSGADGGETKIVNLSANNEMVVVETIGVFESSSTVDVVRNKLIITMNIPEVSVQMAISEQHSVEYAYLQIRGSLYQREFDTSIGLKVNSMHLHDSMRPSDHKAILWTQSRGEAEELRQDERDVITVAYHMINAKMSPLYNGNKSEITLAFSKICLSVDDASTLRFKPFVEELVRNLNKYEKVESADRGALRRQSTMNALSAASKTNTENKPAESHLGGTLIVVSLESVELQILHKLREEVKNDQRTDLLLRSSRKEGMSSHETAFRLECDDIYASINLKQLKEVNAHIKSFGISDARRASKKFFYNTLISRSVLAGPQECEADYLLTFSFLQKSAKTNVVDVTLRDITSVVSVDLFLAFAKLLMSNANAASSVMEGFSSDSQMQQLAAENAEKMKAMLKASIVQSSRSQAMSTFRALNKKNLRDISKEEQENSSTIVSFQLINPRLLLIENPELASSKAIVSHCKLSFQYVREVRDEEEAETRESMHASLVDAQVFVMTNMETSTAPHLIVEPTGVDFHLNRMCEKGKVLSNQMTLNTDNISSRVSLNDIVLASAILARASLVRPSDEDDRVREQEDVKRLDIALRSGENGSDLSGVDNDDESQQQPVSLTLYNVRVNLAQVNVMLINDYNSQNIPIAKMVVDNAEFSASGVPQELRGEGSVIINAEYYNTAVSSWEPIVEPWYPTLNLTVDFNGIELELSSAQTVQVNVSGALCKCLYNANWLMSQIGKEGSYGIRKVVNPLEVRNLLGIPVELFDSQAQKLIVRLNDSAVTSIPPCSSNRRASAVGTKYAKQLPNHPDLFDLKFVGKFAEERLSLQHLPLYINKPRPYTLQTTQGMAAKKNVYGEPIVEEAFQNQRYYPLQGSWGEPWAAFNECAPFTDIRGNPKPDLKQILPPKGWVWVEPQWRVDRSGEVGKEIDKEGFEYGTAFSAFGHAKKRRTKQPMDSVRRCRWVRTRAPQRNEEEPLDTNARPLVVMWDVVSKSDGTREISLRSGVQIRNEMPFPIHVDIVESASSTDSSNRVVVVEEGALFSVPLLQSFFSHLRMRPAMDDAYNWSENVYCKARAKEHGAVATEVSVVYCSSRETSPVYMRVCVTQQDKSLMVCCSPGAVVFNRLPCSIAYQFVNSDGASDTHELRAGGQSKVVLVNFDVPVDAVFTVVPFVSTHPFRITNTVEVREQQFVLTAHSQDENLNQLSVTLHTLLTQSGQVEVYLYSKFALIDRSGCDLLTRTRRMDIKSAKITNAFDCIERRTYAEEPSAAQKAAATFLSMTATDKEQQLAKYWSDGSHGMTLFQSADNKVSLGVNRGRGWCHDIALDSLESSKTVLEVLDNSDNSAYNLAFMVTPLLGAFSATQVLTVMPCFMVVNCMDEPIQLLQLGGDVTQHVFTVGGKESKSWHKANASAGTTVFVKSESSAWSIGTIDLNDIGSNVMVLPRGADNHSYGCDLMVAHVEVKFSDAKDDSYITIVIWRSEVKVLPRARHPFDASSASLSIRNDSDLPIVIQQAGVSPALFVDTDLKAKFDLCVPPSQWQAYGWADPNASSSLLVSVGTSSQHLDGSPRSIDTLLIGQVGKVDLSHLGAFMGEVRMVMKALGNGKLLHIYNEREVGENAVKVKRGRSPLVASALVLKCNFASMGFSLVAERPGRREFMSLYVDSFELLLRRTGASETDHGTSGVELKIMDLQVDNYSETVVYPVLVNSFNGSERAKIEKARKRAKKNSKSHKGGGEDSSSSTGNSGEEDPEMYFIQFAAVKENTVGQAASVLKYVAFRMLDTKVCVDSSTIFLYMCDLHADLFTNDAGIDTTDPDAVTLYVNNFNRDVVRENMDAAAAVNVDTVFQSAQANKLYFESLVIHPIKLKLTFTPSTCPRSQRTLNRIPAYRSMRRIQNVGTVEDFEIKINSFIVNNAMESLGSLQSRILAKIRRDMQAHLVQIAGNLFGSLSLLGKPAGLYKNIGSGVQDFFYEPYMGMMQSPTGFVRGIGIGTGSLVTGVASGVITSAATIVGTATGSVNSMAKGVVNMTGDDKYVKQREEKRRETKAAQGGIASGFLSGGESIMSGFTSGLSGLVTKPYEEGKKAGALGFVKGIGMGIVGAAVKPVMGVTDGITSVAHGFTQQLADVAVINNVRPSRAFERSTADPDDLILVNVDLFAAEAQNFVVKTAARKDYKDRYHNSLVLGFERMRAPLDSAYALVVTDVFLFLLSKQCSLLWQVPFGDISHFAFKQGDPNSVELLLYRSSKSADSLVSGVSSGAKGSGFASLVVTCVSRLYAVKLYSLLFNYAYRLGNPTDVLPVDVASQLSGSKEERAKSDQDIKISNETSNSTDREKPTKDKYQFGAANALKVPTKTAVDKDILSAIAERLRHVMPMDSIKMNDLARVNEYHRQLDESVWHAISSWRANHGNMWNMSRCAACLVVNYSQHHVQILGTELKEGSDLRVFGVALGYDQDSRSILPNGGAVLIFAYGYAPSLTDLAHIKMHVSTSAFSANVSTRKNRTDCRSIGGFHAGFLEKTEQETWAKCSISIN